jgi:hypothetical protein
MSMADRNGFPTAHNLMTNLVKLGQIKDQLHSTQLGHACSGATIPRLRFHKIVFSLGMIGKQTKK